MTQSPLKTDTLSYITDVFYVVAWREGRMITWAGGVVRSQWKTSVQRAGKVVGTTPPTLLSFSFSVSKLPSPFFQLSKERDPGFKIKTSRCKCRTFKKKTLSLLMSNKLDILPSGKKQTKSKTF